MFAHLRLALSLSHSHTCEPVIKPTRQLGPSVIMLFRLASSSMALWACGFALLPWLVLAQNTSTTPTPPGLTYLYTLNCTLGETIDIGPGPRGYRVAIPITGGYFNGPRMSGKKNDVQHLEWSSRRHCSSTLLVLAWAVPCKPRLILVLPHLWGKRLLCALLTWRENLTRHRLQPRRRLGHNGQHDGHLLGRHAVQPGDGRRC